MLLLEKSRAHRRVHGFPSSLLPWRAGKRELEARAIVMLPQVGHRTYLAATGTRSHSSSTQDMHCTYLYPLAVVAGKA